MVPTSAVKMIPYSLVELCSKDLVCVISQPSSVTSADYGLLLLLVNASSADHQNVSGQAGGLPPALCIKHNSQISEMANKQTGSGP